ncbi:MAG: hypothetical protein CM1200mP41_16660 [Gammaproteobacteria bacterium]|nr:MAG: hypothetical protein CM1200mP41_16660 [Gammaproteobacteria bacterium]
MTAPRDCLIWGMRVDESVASLGRGIRIDGNSVGRVCSSTWSPYLECGVAIVRMDKVEHGPDTMVRWTVLKKNFPQAVLCRIPFLNDEKREIPRGKLVAIPERKWSSTKQHHL